MSQTTSQSAFRPPAVPLVTMDPYISVWSMADKLTDDWPHHWTGGVMGMFGMVRIDGKAYRWCGPAAIKVPAMEQVSVKVSFLTTTYLFKADGIELSVVFGSTQYLNPDEKSDLIFALAKEPLTVLSLNAHSTDGKQHDVSAYVDFTGEWCTGVSGQEITMSRLNVGQLSAITIARSEQPILKHAGDRVKIDWGTLCVAARSETATEAIGSHTEVRAQFAQDGTLPDKDEIDFPKAAEDNWPVAAFEMNFGKVKEKTERSVFIAFDNKSAIEYFGRPLPPAWKTDGRTVAHVLPEKDGYSPIRAIIGRADIQMTEQLAKGKFSPAYAQILALAYRQCLAGHGLVEDLNGDLLMFAKENTSNGCIGTVDVIFPACPFFLYFSPELMKANLRPVLDYASMPRWKFPFAPHDLGTYPKANGQVYGGGEKTEEDQMPVEETANMLLMMDAVARVEKSTKFAEKYESLLKKWANYLLEKGFDPENQLCTDDFTGHLAHNANLSIKAIIAIRAYADLLEMMGKKEEAKPFIEKAQQWAKDWVKAADEGDHFRLAFDKPGTWSQKYNLVWDKLLGFSLFPQDVIDKELKFYAKHFNKYGLPLDSRATFTKDDWQIWTGSLTSSPADFAPYADTIYKMLNETTSRVPFTDWHDTLSGETRGMYARTVVGGVFMKLLMDSGKLKK